MEAKEIEDAAWEDCGYSAKAVRKLAKEAAWNEVEREAQRQLEEEIDAGRVALGLLADTPLGVAEIERMEREREGSIKEANGKRRSRKAKGQQSEADA